VILRRRDSPDIPHILPRELGPLLDELEARLGLDTHSRSIDAQ
jgi:hypothetical protein